MSAGKQLLKIHGSYAHFRSLICPNQPSELAWQWQVKDDPSLDYCGNPCVSKACPKKSFFPRFKKTYVPAEVYSCKRPKKKLSWKEYFSFLLPDKMTAAKPPHKTCRKLLAIRHDKCLDPQDWDCCNICDMSNPKEWYGQAVVHAVVSSIPEIRPAPKLKACAPPDHMIPRCVIAKKGETPAESIKNKTACEVDYVYRQPYSDFKGFSLKKTTSKISKFVCRFKCFEDIPKVHDKSINLACRWFAEYKDVPCPKQMFTRFKDISITPCGNIKPITAKEVTTCDKVEVKKGVCGRQSFLRPRGVRNFSTTIVCPYIKSKDCLKTESINETQPNFQENCTTSTLKNNVESVGCGLSESNNWLSVQSLPPANVLQSNSFEDLENMLMINGQYKYSIADKFEDKKRYGYKNIVRSFSTSVVKHGKKTSNEQIKNNNNNKKEKQNVQICSGCPGVRAALNPVKRGGNEKCRVRSAGKCPGPTRETGPNDPPIMNPYWKCRSQALSICNQPRPVAKKKDYGIQLPCQPQKKLPPKPVTEKKELGVQLPCQPPQQKLHTSAFQLFECRDDDCTSNNKKKKEPRPLEIKRESCFPEKDTKKNDSKGFICKIASALGIGCGKK